MYIEGNSPLHRLTGRLLNAVSIFFKFLSLVNLKRKSLAKEKFPDTFIISVDNLSFGGTGKTTLVIEIGKYLETNNIKFAVVTRGYKSRFESGGTMVQPQHTAAQVGDEAKLFKHRFPNQDIFIGKNRKDSIKKAIANSNHIILLDDGFQTTNVFKNIKIMLFNPHHPYYFLRNFKFLMKNEDYIFYYKSSAPYPYDRAHTNGSESINKPICGSYDFEQGPFSTPEGKSVSLLNVPIFGFSALGDNFRFKNDLSVYRLNAFKGYGDHHAYTETELDWLNQQRIQHHADYLVCTEKDFMKIKHFNLTQFPLIYAQNSIKLSFDLMGCILKDVKKD